MTEIMPNTDTRAVVTEEDTALRKKILRYIVSTLDEPCSDGDMPDDRSDQLDRIITAHRIAAEARVSAREEVLREALQEIADGWWIAKPDAIALARAALHTDGAGS